MKVKYIEVETDFKPLTLINTDAITVITTFTNDDATYGIHVETRGATIYLGWKEKSRRDWVYEYLVDLAAPLKIIAPTIFNKETQDEVGYH